MYNQKRTDKTLELLLEHTREFEKKNMATAGSSKKKISLTPQQECITNKFARQAGQDIGEIVSILIHNQIL